jgi:hypothetical protein
MVPLYKKADWIKFQQHMLESSPSLLDSQSQMADSLWTAFKTALTQGIESFIPHCAVKKKDSLPWITPQIRKLLRWRKRFYLRQKQHPTPKLISKYKEVRCMLQMEMRRAYWDYTNDVVAEPVSSDPWDRNKRFWTYVKHCKQDSIGISPLLDKSGTLHTDS